MRILVTGASGLLGLNLCLRLSDDHQVVGVLHLKHLIETPFSTIQSDLMDDEALDALIEKTRPDILFNCAAMANIDTCELQPLAAHQVNAILAGRLACACNEHGIRFVHISTDAVFDGRTGDYSEEEAPNPVSVYGRSKLEGEGLVAAENSRALIARVNFYGYSLSGRRSLAEFFLDKLFAGKRVNGFKDALFCPLYAYDLVEILLNMLKNELSGIYHVVSPQSLSKYDFGVRIAELFGLDETLIQPQAIREGGLLAERSPRLTLRIDKLKAASITPPTQAESLARFHAHYLEKLPDRIKHFNG